MTMLIVTHEMSLRPRPAVADRIIFMEKGRIVEAGEPGVHLLREPRSERTRAFLKAVPGSVEHDPACRYREPAAQRVPG